MTGSGRDAGRLLELADSIAASAHPLAGVSPSRAGCWMAREALELTVDDLLGERGLRPTGGTMRSRLIALRIAYADEPAVGYRAAASWWRLSAACHHHAFELNPTYAEAASLVAQVRALRDRMKTMSDALANPVLNGPYDPPSRHFEIDPGRGPTGNVLEGRRPSESYIPVAPVRKRARGGKSKQPSPDQLMLTLTNEQVERNTLINDLRREVELWRGRGYDGVTPIDAQAAAALGRSRPGEPGALRPARGGRDRDLPGRGRRSPCTATRTGARGSTSRTPSTTPACRGSR